MSKREQIRRTGGVTVTDAQIVQFAALTRDFSRLHTDAVYAADSIFGRRVGHGLLGLSLAEGLLTRCSGPHGLTGAWQWTFGGPFFAGDTLVAEAEITRHEQHDGRLYAVEKVRVFATRAGGTDRLIQEGQHMIALAPERGLPEWLEHAAAAPFPPFASAIVREDGALPVSTATPAAFEETGVFFDDLSPGGRFTTPAMTVSDFDGAAFAGLIGDMGPWFHDHTLARAAGLAGALVPPLFGLVLVEGLKYALAPDRGVGIPMASLSWTWHQRMAVTSGTTVDLDVMIEGARASRSKHDRGVVAQRIALRSSSGATLHEGQHVQLFRRRPMHPTHD